MKIKLLLCFIVFAIFSCKKNNESTVVDNLPEVGVYANLNGISYRSLDFNEATKVDTILTSIFSHDSIRKISISISFKNTKVGMNLLGVTSNGAVVKYYNQDGSTSNFKAINGILDITKYDLNYSKLSGKFYFKALNDINGDSIIVTDGIINNVKLTM